MARSHSVPSPCYNYFETTSIVLPMEPAPQSSYLNPSSGNFVHQVEGHNHFVAHGQQASESHIPRCISQPSTFVFSNTQEDPSFDHHTSVQQYEPSIEAWTPTYNYALPSPEEFIAGLQVPGEFSAATVRHDLPPYYSPGSDGFPSNSLSANGLLPFSFPQNPQVNEDIYTDYEFPLDTEANC